MERSKGALCRKLFLKFLKIGAFTFGGGYAMIPLIQREVTERRRWLEDRDILDIGAIAESTPGPFAINTATFVGYQVCGTLGAFCAALGVVLVWQLLPIGDDSGCQPLFDVPHDLQINGLSLRLDEALEVDQRSRLLSLQPYYMCNTVSSCIICIAQFVCQAYSCGILLRFYKTAPEDLTIPCYADTGRKMIVRKM